VQQNLQRARTILWVVYQDLRNHVDSIGRRPRSEDFNPWVCFDLGELEL
jgi:hypothetical protein